MEFVLAILAGVLLAGSVFLMLGGNLIRFVFGLVLASNAVNLVIFAGGRLNASRPPLISEEAADAGLAMANSLPQALILTAIVIGFALLVFIFILFYRTYTTLGTVEAETLGDGESALQGKTAERMNL